MRVERDPDPGGRDSTSLEERLQTMGTQPTPDDLLDRCLATVPELPGDHVVSTEASPRRRWSAWTPRMAAAAAAVLMIGVVAIVARPRAADAASLLQEVQKAEILVPASHTVWIMRGPDGSRREEIWYARDRGRRTEIRLDDRPSATVVRTRRWEFRWDIGDRLVAAWSTEINAGHRGPNDSGGRVFNGEEMIRWAEKHRAEVHAEAGTLDGRKLRKITLRWPGPDSSGTFPRDETIWFEPDTLRPVRHDIRYDDGRTLETRTDYPEPAALADDLFTFRPPPDVTIEINDPDLGRQVYSEGRTGGTP